MIDKQRFAEGMGMLAGNFGREIDAPISRGYYAILSPKLTTDEFNAVVLRAMREETFWPPAARLLELAGRAQDEADAALDALRQALRVSGGPRYLPAQAWAELPDATKRAVVACGGLWRINGMDGEHEARIRRKFVEAYHAPVVKQLDAPHPDSRIERLISETAESLTPNRP